MQRRSNHSWKRSALIVLCVFLALVLLLLVGATIWIEYMLGRIKNPEQQATLSMEEIASILNETDATNPDFTGPEVNPEDVTMPQGPVEIIQTGEEVINILLVGQDTRDGHRAHSDAMILCTINKRTKTLTMTSFMRDMYLRIPGYGKQRINVAYLVGGFPMLDNTLKENFGVVVDRNIEVDFSAFQKCVDLVGGVDINLTTAEAEYLNRRGNWDVEENQGWQLKEGVNCLTGSQALAYSRIRAIGDDFGRTSRQRTVLNALLEKAKHMDLGTLYSLMDAVVPMLTTDMQDSEIIGYVMELAPLLSELKVVNQRIPADGTYSFARVDGMEVILPNFEKNWQLLQDTIGGE